MKFITCVPALLLLLSTTACQKNVSDKADENNQKAEEFKTFLSGSKFHAVDYYAESPIDYDETDGEVKLETDLKKYIRDYIVDDDIIFGTGTQITFVQNAVKIGSISSAEIHMPYRTWGDKSGVLVDYIDDMYQPLTYYLHEKGSTYFVLSWKRPQDGIRLFSRYEMVL